MTENLSQLGPEAPIVTEDGFAFRDLNKNGRLDPYEDSRRPIDERVEDLLSQMTLEEKAGMMFHTMLGMGEDGHTASLFPDGWAMRGGAPDPTRDAMPMSPNLPGLTAAVYAPRAQSFRLTMTGFLKQSRRIFFLVSGESKRATLSRVLKGDPQLPASWMNLDHTRFLVTRDAIDADRL